MAFIEHIIKKIMDSGVITSKTQLSKSVFKIEIHSEAVKPMDFIPGCFIRLGVGIGQAASSKKDMVRSYSIWSIDKDNNTFSLAIATHSNGIGAQWVKDCKVGDSVYYKVKRGKFTVDTTADSYLMLGDLSALSHLYIINRYLPKDKHVESIIYNKNIPELYADIDDEKPFNLYSIEENNIKEIIAKIDEVIPHLKGVKMAYIAGDSRVCIAVNNYLRKELKWDTKHIKTKPFWNPDKKGLE
ncbi:siderophore-interacting protein [Formosa agariphila KMM 3901]|uniref:Siderophore-interacting protein n=1 Tax=Formosa agariphila (strain DSM 15362 / KCTC 12365 / LMG 23005 / KMM 3901 / M-2Alg 35-1) TaxID=1347342 RepID=T2KL77_FORAG|nr:siderophore-interacting protein [Formosa agariphila]CDF79490.1 siderophore-interacting protein [Formosa agariphila KMM 3901]